VDIRTRDERETGAAAQRYLSRELSMLQFQERVLDQTRRGAHPLLERLKFLAISDANLDEFLSIQFSLLLGRVEVGDTSLTADGYTQTEQVRRVRDAQARLMREQRRIFRDELLPDLEAAGVHLRPYRELPPAQRGPLQQWFLREVLPVCTPLAVDPAHPFPFISNFSLNLGVMLWDAQSGLSFARIKVPAVLPRLVRADRGPDGRGAVFVWLEDIIANNLGAFFQGVDVRSVFLFRLVRDAEIEFPERESVDLREVVQAGVRRRRFGEAVCLQLEHEMPESVAGELVKRLDVYPEDVYVVGAPLGLRDLAQVADLDRPDLKDPVLLPRVPAAATAGTTAFFEAIRGGDILLHHPYESFASVQAFITQASADPDVLTIKQTLYRVGRTSPLVQALLEAVDRGKQVAAVLELQARGDEESNIDWARTLERAGAHVSYGVIGLKTHAKVSLIVRREPDGLRRYVHVGTGNYSSTPYADLSLFTCRPAIGEDATALFNVLTGHSRQDRYEHLLVAPAGIRSGLLARIAREVESHRLHGGGRLIFKANALVDLEIIDALYEASRAGVRVDLLVRGMCCLRPGVPGLSETIRVVSIVGRFLEHSRVYYFRNGGQHETLIGSADLMERNLDQRVEVLVPVLDAGLAAALRARLLDLQLRDTVRAMEMQPDGAYRRVPADGTRVDAQLTWTSSDMTFMA